MKPEWKQVRCPAGCYAGTVAVYSAADFEGPGECETCKGSGGVWVSPKGAMALYPGGPFCGRGYPRVEA